MYPLITMDKKYRRVDYKTPFRVLCVDAKHCGRPVVGEDVNGQLWQLTSDGFLYGATVPFIEEVPETVTVRMSLIQHNQSHTKDICIHYSGKGPVWTPPWKELAVKDVTFTLGEGLQ